MRKSNDHQIRYVPIIYGILTALIVSVLGCGALTFLYLKSTVDEKAVSWLIPLLQAVSAMLGTMVAKGKHRDTMVLNCVLTTVGIFALYSLMHIILSGGRFRGVWMTILMIVIGTGLTFLSELFIKRGYKTKGMKNAFR